MYTPDPFIYTVSSIYLSLSIHVSFIASPYKTIVLTLYVSYILWPTLTVYVSYIASPYKTVIRWLGTTAVLSSLIHIILRDIVCHGSVLNTGGQPQKEKNVNK